MKSMFVRFVREDAGQDLIEYALLVGIITIGAVVMIGNVGTHVKNLFTTLNTTLGTVSGS
jgi:pilus assembly protein Flp/PilA